MTDTQTAGVHLVGGEMLKWSDAEGDSGRLPVQGEILGELLATLVPSGARVLLAGPHDRSLVEQAVRLGGRVTCLLRSLADASDLAERLPKAEVWCGGLDKLDAAGAFDVVLALDGLDRLGTPDSAGLDWRVAMTRLGALVAPGGTLAAAVENELGVHRLVETDRPELRQSNAWWQPADPWVAGPAAVDGALGDADLRADQWYAGYPRPAAPALLLGFESAEGCRPGSVPARLLDAVCADGFGDRLMLGEPRELVAGAVRGALAARLAPFWIVVARPAGGCPLPDALVLEGGPDPRWSAVSVLATEATGRWARRPGGAVSAPRTIGRVVRDVSRLSGLVPEGSSVEHQLLAACRRHDLPAVRTLLRGYAAWLAADPRLFATFDNVGCDGDRFAMLDSGGEWAEPVPFEHALARVLRRFAARLVSAGVPHPWPSGLDVHEITAVLHAIAGHPADPALLHQGIRLEAEILATLHSEAETERARLETILAAGSVTEAIGRPSGHRELVAAHALLSEEVRFQRARAAAAEKELRQAGKQLAKVERTLCGVRGSASFKVGRLLTAPLRLIRR